MLQIISDACGKRKWSAPVPTGVVKLAAFFFDRFSFFPVTRDQITMLENGNVCESDKYYSDFNIDEITFDTTALEYLS